MIHFRKPTIEDCNLYFDWANEALVREQSFNSNPIIFSEHEKWFKDKLNDADTEMLLFYNDDTVIGQVRIQKNGENNAVIGISVDKDQRRKGYAVEMLKIASVNYSKKYPEVIIEAYIKTENYNSQTAFENVGYIRDSLLEYLGSSTYKYIYNANR